MLAECYVHLKCKVSAITKRATRLSVWRRTGDELSRPHVVARVPWSRLADVQHVCTSAVLPEEAIMIMASFAISEPTTSSNTELNDNPGPERRSSHIAGTGSH